MIERGLRTRPAHRGRPGPGLGGTRAAFGWSIDERIRMIKGFGENNEDKTDDDGERG